MSAGARDRDRLSGHAYWQARAQLMGARAVVNVDHDAGATLDAVTDGHRAVLLPAIAALLDGSERAVLDLGCGTGRFTADLAALIGGRGIGVDPVAELLALAPASPDVDFRLSVEGEALPLADDEVDVVMTLTVLGGLLQPGELETMAAEVRRVLRPGGLLVLAESVSEQAEVEHWTPRTAAEYAEVFAFAPLREVARFDDAGDPISVLAGRSAG
ncbi:MAG: class SAM-dependent methyltransferase [Solirubrobacterales bacterium]|nr:class SAM-dependent methyltransferase [Solirubrobacterales bacterium]